MSCGCSNTTPITTTTNCGSCGYNCTNCTCPTNPIIEPVVVCADPEPCSELFPLECVIYTGVDIACAGTANTLYPNVLHYVVLENSSTTARNFVSILNNINAQLCYLFSKDYISQFLTNIQGDATLSALFCSIVSACDCDCTLTCGTVISAEYIVNTETDDTIDVEFTQVTGGNTINFQGTISGTTLTVTTPPVSGAIAVGQKINTGSIASNTFIIANLSPTTWTLSAASTVASPISIGATHITYIVSIYKLISGSYYYLNEQISGFLFPDDTTATASVDVPAGNDNTTPWLVSVWANDELSATECTSGYYVPEEETPVPIENYDGCGFGFTAAVPALECPTICIPRCISIFSSPECLDHWGSDGSTLSFTFTHTNPPITSYQVDYYILHWYKQTAFGITFANNQYIMQAGDSPTNTITPTLPSQPISIFTDIPYNTPDTWLLLITPVLVGNTECNTGFAVRPYNEENPSATVPYSGSELLRSNCNWFIYDKR